MEVFEHLLEWQVVVCKQCRCAVWPAEVTGHLTSKQHAKSRKQARSIADEIEQWPGVVQYPSEFKVPKSVSSAISQLPVFDDGLQCRVTHSCRYTVRDVKSMKEHLRISHGWSTQAGRGGSIAKRKTEIQARLEAVTARVQCQRFFTSRANSQYFSIEDQEVNVLRTDGDIWTRVWERANQNYDAQRESDIIVPGESDEVNPWLRRTGWISYLKGCKESDLLKTIERPEADTKEDIAVIIWDAVQDMAIASEQAVRKSGVMLRFEAVRTEAGQVRHVPLEAYRNEERVTDRCRSWQKIVMFFVRTQQGQHGQMPRYRFNRRQEAAFQRLIAAARDAMANEDRSSEESEEENVEEDGRKASSFRPVHAAALQFCIELLNQSMQRTETEMALVCAIAVLGVRPKGGGFYDASGFTSTLSGIIKIAHFMVVKQAAVMADPHTDAEWPISSSVCQFEDEGYESEVSTTKRYSRSQFGWVKKMMDAFMVRGTATPMQWILDLRAYGLKIDHNTTSEGHVGWKDGDTLTYKDIHFSMTQFRGMVDQLRATTQKQLLEIMFAKDEQDVPQIPWPQLFDDPSNDSAAWSFVDDSRTPWPVDGKQWLFERIQKRPECRQRFVSEQTASGIHEAKFRDWLKTVEDFQGQLLVLMHITGGQPARGPEILSVRHSNTVQGRHRNLFIEDGMVVFVTQYHKGAHFKGNVKIIHRYLPREVGQLLVWYRWLVVPFVQRIKAYLWKTPVISDHLWGPSIDGRAWTTERMKGHLQRATEAGLGHAIHVAAYRHIAIAISRKWTRAEQAFGEEEGWEPQDDVNDEQAAHSPFTAGMVYAREMHEMPGSIASKRQQFRSASVEWHRVLGFRSSVKDEVQKGIKRGGDAFERYSKRARVERSERIRQMDAVEELTWMTGQEMSLRPGQAESFQAIQQGDSKIVSVMPTGGGKSMLFMLPAFASTGGVTVVVVPFRSLRGQMRQRCQELNISVAEWDGKRSVDGKSIVFVTPEAAVRSGFQTFLRRITQTEQLDRIVIDECHTMLGEQGGFRENIRRLGKLASAHTQMLLVTATLPPAEEQQLWTRMFWQPEEVTLIRVPTVRTNIEYSVTNPYLHMYTDEKEGAYLRRFVLPMIQQGGKAVIICNDIERIGRIIKDAAAGWMPYHNGISAVVRDATLDAFGHGAIPVLIATSMFGTGIDVPDVRVVVHITLPDNLREYGQESGRGGRDGQPSKAIIMHFGGAPKDEHIKEYITTPGCRRIVLDGYLDGATTRSGCQEGEARCDRCQEEQHHTVHTMTPPPSTPYIRHESRAPAPPQPTPGLASSLSVFTLPSSPIRHMRRMEEERAVPDQRRREHVRDVRVWQEDLRARLHRWKNVCVMCQGHGGDSMHAISRCTQAYSRPAEKERAYAQKGIKFPPMHVCFRCGLPRTMCDRWSDDGRARAQDSQGQAIECQFYGIMIGVIYGTKHAYPGIWAEWMAGARRDPQWAHNVHHFLALPLSESEGHGCQIGRVFMLFTDRIAAIQPPESSIGE